MYIIELISKKKALINVRRVQIQDFKKVTVKRYFFNWKSVQDSCEVYKLTLQGNEDILGLIAIVDHPAEERLEIKLLTVSVENAGSQKKYDRIAGCLIGFTCREAIKRYTTYPCVSLTPKTELKSHYINKYGMFDGGRQVYLEDESLINIIKTYYHD